MKAGILAAGRGERLRDSGELKPLVQVAGRPLITHVLRAFSAIEIDEVAVIINEDSERVRGVVMAENWPFSIRWIVKTTQSSMHSFLRLLEHLSAENGGNRFLIATVDTVLDPKQLVAFTNAASPHRDSAVTLAINEPADDDNPLWVTSDEAGCVRGFGDPTSKRATAGVYIVDAVVLREAKGAERDRLMSLRNFLGRLLERDYKISAVSIGNSIDVDRSADIIAAEKLLKQHQI
ncbi:MAG: NDP-sugar synthase [Chthoniobacterales bacterium]|jgi:NDP-sugar pyrophosphorylase family protein